MVVVSCCLSYTLTLNSCRCRTRHRRPLMHFTTLSTLPPPTSYRLCSFFCCCWGAHLRSRSFHHHKSSFSPVGDCLETNFSITCYKRENLKSETEHKKLLRRSTHTVKGMALTLHDVEDTSTPKRTLRNCCGYVFANKMITKVPKVGLGVASAIFFPTLSSALLLHMWLHVYMAPLCKFKTIQTVIRW